MIKELENLYESKFYHIETPILKLSRMQEIYLSKNEQHYKTQQIEKIRKCFEALIHKYSLGFLHLELIWKQSETSREEVLLDISNSLKEQKWTDSRKVIGSLLLESFLFQIKSMLDIYQKYSCLVVGIEKPNYDGLKGFYSGLSNVIEPFDKKAYGIKEYFKTKVYNIDGWGSLLKDLRDKIAHYDFIKYSYDGDETIFDDTLLKWPTLRGLTYDRFCQNMENNLFYLIIDTSQIFYELEWKSGHYSQNLWD